MKHIKPLNRSTIEVGSYNERIIQFGEGNFLRAFADWMIHKMNKMAGFDGGVVVVQPIEQGMVKMLNDQDGLYTLYLNGIKNGEVLSESEIVDCIQRGINPYENYTEYLAIAENPDLRFVISNTTEAGINYDSSDTLKADPPSSYPGKLTALLYNRFQFFDGALDKGLIVLPCELIDRNGDNLKKVILQYSADWNLGNEFVKWIHEANIFCNTLVDRIVPGFPRDKMESITKELGFQDRLVVESEQFYLWVIEGHEKIKNEFPTEKCGLNVVFTDNMEPYRTRKVRILNGAHTTLVPVGYLYGIDRVRESLEDDEVGKFLKEALYNNIVPTLDLPQEELLKFTEDVLDRFRNPYLDHELMSISLNSISKFKTRVLPSVLEFKKRTGNLPSNLIFSLAALIVFYKGVRNGKDIALKDSPDVLEFFKKTWRDYNHEEVAYKTLSNEKFWGTDLTSIKGLSEEVSLHMEGILNDGMERSLKKFVKTT